MPNSQPCKGFGCYQETPHPRRFCEGGEFFIIMYKKRQELALGIFSSLLTILVKDRSAC